ncbi:MAG TPA: carboxypeptidase regulatory-like domain-containing protein [Pyrinomonadaceae bacterium]
MASSTRQAIACIILIFAIVVEARSQSGPEKRQGATFNGKVTIKGRGAPGIAVGLIRIEESMQQPTHHRTLTDDQGNYKITNVPPGKYQLTVVAPGLIPADVPLSSKTFLINKSETLDNVDFALVRGGVITGKVTDADGRPLVEEHIMVLPAEAGPGAYFRYTAPPNTRTDDRGIYRIFGVPPGKYRIAAGQNEGDFGSRVHGYRRTFHPTATEMSQATIIEVSEGSEATNVDIALADATGGYSARGRIIDGDTGQPLPNISYGVQKYITETSLSGHSTGVVTNKEGEFILENLSPGKYAVTIEVPPNSDWRADYVQFEVTNEDVTGVIVKATKGASASGVIVLEGTQDKTIHERLRKARLYAYSANNDATRGSTVSSTINEDGSFRIAGLPAGNVILSILAHRFHVVRIERGGLAQPQSIEVKEREQITGVRLIVNYADGAIQGVVKVDGGSIPANSHLGVSLKRIADASTQFASSRESAQVDARGQFFAEGLLPGTYEVTATYATDLRTAWRRSTQQVVVTNGAVANVTLTLDTSANPGRP